MREIKTFIQVKTSIVEEFKLVRKITNKFSHTGGNLDKLDLNGDFDKLD